MAQTAGTRTRHEMSQYQVRKCDGGQDVHGEDIDPATPSAHTRQHQDNFTKKTAQPKTRQGFKFFCLGM